MNLINSTQVEYGYNSARKTLEVYKPFEDQLLVAQSNEELLNTYREYIKHVTDPSTIICVYERAAAQLCLVPGNFNFLPEIILAQYGFCQKSGLITAHMYSN